MARVITLLLLFMSPFMAGAQTFTGSGGMIPDDGVTAVDFPLTVSGLVPAQLSTSHGLVSVCVNINHTYDADLSIYLTAPDGTMILLVSGAGGSGDNFSGTCFDQSAASFIDNGAPPFTGSWKPMSNLGYINNGQNGNGVWKLHLFDGFSQDQGTLINWSITFGSNAVSIAPFTTSNLPIILINTNNQNIPDDPKLPAQMGIVDNGTGMMNHITDPKNGYDGRIGIELRGSSSQSFPKKSYGLETWTATGTDTNVSLLGMPRQSDWILSANYTDKSLLNNALAYEVFNRFGSYAPRTRFVELMLNGQYQGVYVMMEKIKRDSARVDVSKLKEDDTAGSALTGGYILKIDKYTGSGGDGFPSSFPPAANPSGQTVFFQYEYPSEDKIHTKQKQYIKRFVDSFENALKNLPLYDTTTGWRHYADETSFIRYFLLNELSKNVDGYRLSTFLYKTKDTKGNKLFVGPPWDYDIAFGNADYCGGDDATGWGYEFGTVCGNDGNQVPFWWSRLMQDTIFKNKLQCTFSQMRATVLDTTQLFSWIDSTAFVLNSAKDRNFEKWPILGVHVWPNPVPVPNSYAGEITELKNWLRNRLQWLDANMPGTCWPAPTSLENMVASSWARVFPNPFVDELMLETTRPGKYEVQVLSADGKLIQAKTIQAQAGKNSYSIAPDHNSLMAGFYLVKVFAKDKVKVFKVIKQ